MGLLGSIVIPLDVGTATYDAASVGVKPVPKRFIVPSFLTQRSIIGAKLILSYVWAATADGTIRLYDYTAGAAVAQTTTKVGGESSVREEVSIPAPWTLIGHEVGVDINITVAGAAGEAVTLRGALLKIDLAA